MSGLEVIWRWATLLLAEILNISANAAEVVLRGQPRWVAHLRLMSANLRAAPLDAEAEAETKLEATADGGARSDAGILARVLASYAVLNRSLRGIKSRGLALDDGLLERMKDEWTPDSIVSYLKTCDTQLKLTVDATLNEAAAALGPVEVGTVGTGDSEASAAAAPPPASRKRQPVQPKELTG